MKVTEDSNTKTNTGHGIKSVRWTDSAGQRHSEQVHGQEQVNHGISPVEAAEDWMVDNPTAEWGQIEWFGFTEDELVDIFDTYRDLRHG